MNMKQRFGLFLIIMGGFALDKITPVYSFIEAVCAVSIFLTILYGVYIFLND